MLAVAAGDEGETPTEFPERERADDTEAAELARSLVEWYRTCGDECELPEDLGVSVEDVERARQLAMVTEDAVSNLLAESIIDNRNRWSASARSTEMRSFFSRQRLRKSASTRGDEGETPVKRAERARAEDAEKARRLADLRKSSSKEQKGVGEILSRAIQRPPGLQELVGSAEKEDESPMEPAPRKQVEDVEKARRFAESKAAEKQNDPREVMESAAPLPCATDSDCKKTEMCCDLVVSKVCLSPRVCPTYR